MYMSQLLGLIVHSSKSIGQLQFPFKFKTKQSPPLNIFYQTFGIYILKKYAQTHMLIILRVVLTGIIRFLLTTFLQFFVFLTIFYPFSQLF